MAVGDTLTLRKTETGIPWHIGLGAMQHLTPQYARIMLAQPWYTWTASGIPTLEVTRVPVASGVNYAIWSGGIGEVEGIGAECTGNIIDATRTITREGSLSSNCKTQTIPAGVTGDCRANGLFMQDGNNFVMRFYTSENGDVWVSPMYGTGDVANKNAQTCLTVDYTRLTNNVRYTASSSLNRTVQPINDKNLYIDDTSTLNFACTDMSRRYYKICSFKFSTSCNVYVTANGINKHLNGDESDNIENLAPKKEVSKDHISTLYFYCQERRGTNPVDFEEWHNHSIRFLVENTTSEGNPLNWQTSVIGYLDYGEGADKYSNHKIVKFHQNSGTIIKCEELINGEWLERAQPQLDIPFSAYRVGMQCTDGYTYVGDIQTNMMIFKSLEDYNAWKENPTNNTWGILENVLSNALVNTTMNTNNINFDVGLGECWILDQNNIKRMANLFNMQLNADLSNIVGNMLIGLGMYDNPVDVVCDLFVLPFDVSEFVTSELSEFALGIQPQEEDEG